MTASQAAFSARPIEITGTAPLLQAADLTRVFDVSRPLLNRVIEREPRRLLTAAAEVSFDIARGETFAIVGESGSGKSTVAKMIVGLLRPTAGRIVFDGTDITAAPRQPWQPRAAAPLDDDLPGPLCQPQPAADGTSDHRRAHPRFHA